MVMISVFWKYQKEGLERLKCLEGLKDIHREATIYLTTKHTRPTFKGTKIILLSQR